MMFFYFASKQKLLIKKLAYTILQLAKLYYQDGVIKKAEFHASQSIAAKMIDTSGDYYILGLQMALSD